MLTAVARRVGAWRRRSEVGVWYHQEYSAPGLGLASRVEHLRLGRGERVLGQLLQERLVRPGDVRPAPKASIPDLAAFHTDRWLDRSMTAEGLGPVFGLEPDMVDVDAMLGASRRAVGGTVAAAEAAASGAIEVAVNLGGGFHHAEPEQGAGFCIFNDVGVAIARLRARGFGGRVAIVDLDFHQGNGNTAAFSVDPSVFVFSLHGSVWSHAEASGGKEIHLTGAVGDRRYLEVLDEHLLAEMKRFRPQLVFYLAGTDILERDPLGSFGVRLEGAFERDRRVFEMARAAEAPVVVTLAGGYGPLAWQSTFQMARAALTGVWRFDERKPPSLRARYAAAAARLAPIELQRLEPDDGLEFSLTEAELRGALAPDGAVDRFLGYYSLGGIELALETYGVADRVRARGFEALRLEGDPSDASRQVLRQFGTKDGVEHLLVELVLRRRYLPPLVEGLDRHEVLFVEWLLLQDPTRTFTLARPPLPGQKHPGLGIAWEVQEMLRQACRRVGLDGVVDHPSHFHGAVACEAEWRFLDPALEGRFRAMMAVAARVDPFEATWAAEEGRFRLADGTVIGWLPEDHALPVDPALASAFEAEAYRREVRAERARLLSAGLTIVPRSSSDPREDRPADSVSTD